MRKTYLFTGLFAVASVLAVGHKASADLILNGNFSGGATGFSTDYTLDSSPGAGETAGSNEGAGYYGIVTDANTWHPLFADFHDHTTGTGNMMIVNGSLDSDQTVWSESNIAVLTGQEYTLTFWAASAYPASPANLNLTVDVSASSPYLFNLTSDAGVWHKFFVTFIAGSSPTTISLLDTNTISSGNDFALDDISLVLGAPATTFTTPLPASALSGTILLAGIAIANKLRRRNQA